MCTQIHVQATQPTAPAAPPAAALSASLKFTHGDLRTQPLNYLASMNELTLQSAWLLQSANLHDSPRRLHAAALLPTLVSTGVPLGGALRVAGAAAQPPVRQQVLTLVSQRPRCLGACKPPTDPKSGGSLKVAACLWGGSNRLNAQVPITSAQVQPLTSSRSQRVVQESPYTTTSQVRVRGRGIPRFLAAACAAYVCNHALHTSWVAAQWQPGSEHVVLPHKHHR